MRDFLFLFCGLFAFLIFLVRRRPTIFVSVPRIYTRLYDRVLASVHAQSWLSRFFFHWALRAKRANLPDHVVTHWLWDWLVRIRARVFPPFFVCLLC